MLLSYILCDNENTNKSKNNIITKSIPIAQMISSSWTLGCAQDNNSQSKTLTYYKIQDYTYTFKYW